MNTRDSIPIYLAATILALTTAPLTVFADGTVDNEITVTWRDIVDTIDQHPQIGAGQQNLEAARAAVDAAGAVPNPTVEATGAYGKAVDNSVSKMEWGLALSIPLGWINQRGAQIDVARAQADVVEGEIKVLRRDVLLQLRIMFWTVVWDQQRVVALDELNGQMTALVTTVKRRVDTGEARPVEVVRVEVEAEKIIGELEVAKLELTASRTILATWLGIQEGRVLVAEANLTKLPKPITQKTAREKAVNHPAMAVADARVQSLEANVTSERRARVPSVEVEVFTDHELDRNAFGIGLAIDLPLWNWNSGNIKSSRHALAGEKKNNEAKRLELETQALEAQSRCQAGVMLATRYSHRILPRAKSAASTIERTYQLGEASLLEVIDARRTRLETKRQYLSALAQAQIDCSRLQSIAGEELQ